MNDKDKLSYREQQVYGLVLQGHSNLFIAKKLALEPNSVSRIQRRIAQKTDAATGRDGILLQELERMKIAFNLVLDTLETVQYCNLCEGKGEWGGWLMCSCRVQAEDVLILFNRQRDA